MIEFPMDDAGKSAFRFEQLWLGPVCIRLKAVAARCQQNVHRVGPVARNAAVLPYLLQRYPLIIIREDHRKAGRAALQRFQLHHYRNLGNLSLHRLPDPFFFTHLQYSVS